MKTAARDNCELVEHPEFETCSAIGARARIGLVVLATDYTIEHEFRRIINIPGVDVYQARIRNEPTITTETLAAMGPLLTDTAALILPGDELDVLAFGCTSASMVMGEAFVDG
jgi:maleate isomerase